MRAQDYTLSLQCSSAAFEAYCKLSGMEDGEAKAAKANLGDFQKLGWYICLLCAVQEFLILSQLSNMTFMIYGGYSPSVKNCGPVEFSGSDRERCLHLSAARNSSSCEVGLDAQFHSVNYEFNLICEDAVLVKNSISLQMFGVMVGALVFGQLSDLFGRKRILLLCLLGMFSCSMLSSLVTSFAAFNVARFFVMVFTGGQSSVHHVFIMENLPKKHRVWTVTLISYSPNYIIFSGIAYFAGDWRALSRYSSLAANIPAMILMCLAHESPRWFVQKGRLEEARQVLVSIDRFNGTLTEKRLAEMDDVLDKEKMVIDSQRKRKRYSFVHLFYTWKLAGYILTLSFALMSASMISYALMFNMDKLSGSIYLNSVFFGLFRYAMNLLVGLTDYFVPKAGRKLIHNVAMGFIFIALFSVFLSTLLQWENAAWITRTATLSAAAMCSQLFLVSGIATTELFPTAVRNLAVSFTAILNRAGSIVAPHLFYSALLWKPLPYFIMLAVITFEMTSFNLVIPETKGTHMADHMPRPEERIFAKKRKTTATTGLLESQ
uniref:MFS domain-containing protein n=1 Tax=Steinernema glaseri TaxID=37863 RepID=A0A1I7YV47_9BILA